MREVAQICRRCGRRYFVQVDAWADQPGLSGMADCGCSSNPSGLGLGPFLFLVALVVLPVFGVLEAFAR